LARFIIGKDYEASERVGAGGMYQIEILRMVKKDDDEIDVTAKIDVGMHFLNDDNQELYKYLSNIFNIPVNNIDIDELS